MSATQGPILGHRISDRCFEEPFGGPHHYPPADDGLLALEDHGRALIGLPPLHPELGVDVEALIDRTRAACGLLPRDRTAAGST